MVLPFDLGEPTKALLSFFTGVGGSVGDGVCGLIISPLLLLFSPTFAKILPGIRRRGKKGERGESREEKGTEKEGGERRHRKGK